MLHVLSSSSSSFGLSRQGSPLQIFNLHLFLSSTSSSVTSTTTMPSLTGHRNHIPPFRPSPFPLSWQFHHHRLRCNYDVFVSDLIQSVQYLFSFLRNPSYNSSNALFLAFAISFFAFRRFSLYSEFPLHLCVELTVNMPS